MTKAEIVLIGIALTCTFAFGHSGGVDKKGEHQDRRDGTYHCHRESCGSANTSSITSSNVSSPSSSPVTPTHVSSFDVPIYDRKDWSHWIDADGNCVDTRHEVLIAQATGPIKKSPDGCFVSMGMWNDPYSGKSFNRANELDIDHVIPLKWAHEHGGFRWSLMVKEAFANDIDNLLVVSKSLNREKGAQGPDQWLPPNHDYRCNYLKLWRKLLGKYQELKMTAAEKRVFDRQWVTCH